MKNVEGSWIVMLAEKNRDVIFLPYHPPLQLVLFPVSPCALRVSVGSAHHGSLSGAYIAMPTLNHASQQQQQQQQYC